MFFKKISDEEFQKENEEFLEEFGDQIQEIKDKQNEKLLEGGLSEEAKERIYNNVMKKYKEILKRRKITKIVIISITFVSLLVYLFIKFVK